MMKKTLLSIMTMAILASSTAAYSNPVNKEIKVEATIPALFSMDDAQGKAIEDAPLIMKHDATSNAYIITKSVKLNGNSAKLQVTMTHAFKLVDGLNTKEFVLNTPTLGGKDLVLNNAVEFTKGEFDKNMDLVISGKEPADALGGETYTGTLKLKLETGA